MPTAVALVNGTIYNSRLSNSISRQIINDNTTIPSGNDVDITLDEFETNVNELNKYQYLNDVFINTFTPLIQLYSQGNFADLSMQFTTNLYRQLGNILENQRDFTNIDLTNLNYNSQTFESYINTFHNTLDGLERASVQYDSLSQLQLEKNHCDNILNNPENLVNYFRATYTGIGIMELNTIVTTVQQPLLRPEYALYIERHGLPIGGIFDSERMSAILIELNIDTSTYALLI
tara:strand:- start:369 stop:1067 length:699 start_codon:yes stop_codon:yes gene_type:complete